MFFIRKKLNLQYVAGVLERTGGFATHKNPNNDRHYLYFKIVTENDVIKKVMAFLESNQKIHSNSYIVKGREIYYVTRKTDIERLICFMRKYCFRTDYRKYKKTKKGYTKIA